MGAFSSVYLRSSKTSRPSEFSHGETGGARVELPIARPVPSAAVVQEVVEEMPSSQPPVGQRQGHVIAVYKKRSGVRVEDTDSFRISLGRLGFQFQESMQYFPEKDQLTDFLKGVADGDPPEVLVLFIITEFMESVMIDEYGRQFYASEITEIFAGEKMKNTKLIIFLQMDQKEEERHTFIHINIVRPTKETKRVNYARAVQLPRSKNTIVMHLPHKDRTPSFLTEMLSQQLSQPVDVETALTYVLTRAVDVESFSPPLYYSNLSQKLCLHQMELQPEPQFTCGSGRKLAYAFLMDQYEKDGLMDFDARDDERLLQSALPKLGFTVHCQRGARSAGQILLDMEQIKSRDDVKEGCDLLCIVISSYGDYDGAVAASDENVKVEELLEQFCYCTDTPKLFIVDGGRILGGGYFNEARRSYKNDKTYVTLPPNSFLIMSYVQDGTRLWECSKKPPPAPKEAKQPHSVVARLCESIDACLGEGRDVDVVQLLQGIIKGMEEDPPQLPTELSEQMSTPTTVHIGYASTLRIPLTFRAPKPAQENAAL